MKLPCPWKAVCRLLGCGAVIALALLAAACGSTRSVETQSSRRPSDPLLNQFAGNFGYGRDSDGTMRVQSDQRSSFEGADGGNVQSRFNARDFNARQWHGSDQAARVHSHRDGGREFRSSNAREQGAEHRYGSAMTREHGTSAREQAQTFQAGSSNLQQQSAREAAVGAREGGVSAAERAATYRPAEASQEQNHRPIMIDRETGQRAYSPNQVRSLLGKGG